MKPLNQVAPNFPSIQYYNQAIQGKIIGVKTYMCVLYVLLFHSKSKLII